MTDFDRFAEPIDGESPCGPDCEYDNDFLALSQAVVGKPEQQFGDTVIPAVDPDWRQVDLLVPSDPALVLHLRVDGLDLRFLTMITAFQAPQNVAVEHLRIETWFPYDDATADACRTLAAAG